MDDVKVGLYFFVIKSDIDIVVLVIKVLCENWVVFDYRIKVIVENGWVIFEGILYWNF